MNRDYVLFHLREALEELQRSVQEIDERPDYSEVELSIAMQHLYNHVNTAWNARNQDQDRIHNLAEEDFYRWRQFPSDISMSP